MYELQQNVMCALLQTLLKQELITEEIFESARNAVRTLDWPDFFCYSEANGEEETNGCTENPC